MSKSKEKEVIMIGSLNIEESENAELQNTNDAPSGWNLYGGDFDDHGAYFFVHDHVAIKSFEVKTFIHGTKFFVSKFFEGEVYGGWTAIRHDGKCDQRLILVDLYSEFRGTTNMVYLNRIIPNSTYVEIETVNADNKLVLLETALLKFIEVFLGDELEWAEIIKKDTEQYAKLRPSGLNFTDAIFSII